MRILVLTFYYTPDLCACSFRMAPFVRALRRATGDNAVIDVLTTMPNRYRSFSVPAAADAVEDGVRVRRIQLPGHASGMVDQSKAFAVFAREVLRATSKARYDLVFATSSRLFTASLGAVVSRRTGAKLYLDLRDIFSETITDVVRAPLDMGLLPALSFIEQRTVRAADRVNLVSEGFRPHFEALDPRKTFRFFTNGIDEVFADFEVGPTPRRDYRTVVYAGNIGESQGLHCVLPGLARGAGDAFRFVVIGDGGGRQKLEAATTGIKNVEIRPPVKRDVLLEAYRDADVLFLHLNDRPAFRRVLPSKLFEYGATGKPVLAGVAGHAAEFLRGNMSNVGVFPPCHAEAGVNALRGLSLDSRPRTEFVERFQREAIMRDLAADVLDTVVPTS